MGMFANRHPVGLASSAAVMSLPGTWWGPYWCPDHDKERLDRISASMDDLLASFKGGSDD